MKHVKSTDRVPAAVRTDRALDRMEQGQPESDRVKRALAAGKNIFTPTLLSVEANVSRTLFGFDKCALKCQRMRLLRLGRKSVRAASLESKLAAANEELRKLKAKGGELMTVVASQAVRIMELEAKAEARDSSRFRNRSKS